MKIRIQTPNKGVVYANSIKAAINYADKEAWRMAKSTGVNIVSTITGKDTTYITCNNQKWVIHKTEGNENR